MKKLRGTLFILIIMLSALQEYTYLVRRIGFHYFYIITQSLDDRPFVYRALLPYLTRAVNTLTGLNVYFCMGLLILLSSIGLYYSIKYLYSSFRIDTKADIIAFISCEALFLIILRKNHVYDVSTAMFFSLSLALLARKKFWVYYLIFPIASVNRETTFLLVIFFFIYFSFHPTLRPHWLFGTAYQVIMFVSIWLLITNHFARNPGSHFWLTWERVLQGYVSEPLYTLLVIMIFGLIFSAVIRRWTIKPYFLRMFLGIVFPIQFILHFTMGLAFEVRVFAEVFPAMLLLALF